MKQILVTEHQIPDLTTNKLKYIYLNALGNSPEQIVEKLNLKEPKEYSKYKTKLCEKFNTKTLEGVVYKAFKYKIIE